MKYQKVTNENPTGSGLDRRFTFTLFLAAHAREKREPRTSLRFFAKRIPQRFADSKAAVLLFKLGRFRDEPTFKGSLRHNANVVAIEGVKGDCSDAKRPGRSRNGQTRKRAKLLQPDPATLDLGLPQPHRLRNGSRGSLNKPNSVSTKPSAGSVFRCLRCYRATSCSALLTWILTDGPRSLIVKVGPLWGGWR